MKRSSSDHNLFFKYSKKWYIFFMYVDDIVITSDDLEEIENLIEIKWLVAIPKSHYLG